MRRLGLAGFVACVAAVSAFAAAGGSAAFPAVGYVYVNDNTAGANTIAGFARGADGTLTPLSGSPFAAGGAGTGSGIASQGSLQLSDDGRYVLAVDAGTDQISVLEVQPGGGLQAVGPPVASNGADPVSIAVHGSLVYVANAGASDTNYTGFTLSPGGVLTPLAGSTVALPSNSQPGDVLFNGDGTKLVGLRVASSQIDSFTVGANGLLSTAPGSPFPAQAGYFGPFGSEFRPTNPEQLFVSNAHTSANGPAPSSVSVFNDGADGTLTAIGGSPFAAGAGDIASCWVEISHDGAYLFAVNTASGTISTYAIGADGTLSYQHSTTLNGGVKGAEDARLAPDGRTLFVVDAGSAKLSSFAVSGGTLSELAQSPTALPSGAAPAGVVVTETNLQGVNLQGVNLQGANLAGASVQGSNLQRANLQNTNLQGANLRGTNMQGVNGAAASFVNAQLQGANLQQGTYTNASFAGANLQGANLQSTNLTGASLSGATLRGANIQAVIWSNTTCPDGTNSNNDSGTCQGHLS